MISTARACAVGFKPLSVFAAYIIACLCSAGSLAAQETQLLRAGISVERNSFGLTATRNGSAALDSGTGLGILIGAIVGFVWP